MNSRKVFWVVAALVVVLALGIFAMAVQADKALNSEADKLVSLKLEGKLLDEQQKALVQANQDIEKYSELEGIANTVVPQDKDQAKTVREIAQIASDNGVMLGSITFPTSTLGTIAPKPTTPQSNSESGTGSTDNTTPKKEEEAIPSITQVKPVTGVPGVFTLEITIQSDPEHPVTYQQFINFLSQLENNRRTAHVTSVSVQPQADNRQFLDFTLTVNVYLKP